MKVIVLASGSKGNATVLISKDSKILIDIGLSHKMLKQKLEEVEINIEQIDGIFITHEHSDHIKGLQTFIKKHNIDVYMSRGTYDAIVGKKQIGLTYEYFHVIEEDEEIQINDVLVNPFLVSHDANEPFGYIFYENSKKFVYLTDTGFVSQLNEEKIDNADIYIIETNHNVEMLMCSNRPWHLKQRILGDYGHLCNEDALNVLHRVRGENTKFVYLAHLSEEANNVDILKMTVDEFNHNNNCHNVKFIVAYQHKISEIVEV